jgi:hypothetical protein
VVVVHLYSVVVVVVGSIDSAVVGDTAVAVHMAGERAVDHIGLVAALDREIEDMVKTFDQVEVGPAYCNPAVPGDMETMFRKDLSLSEVKATAVVLGIQDVMEQAARHILDDLVDMDWSPDRGRRCSPRSTFYWRAACVTVVEVWLHSQARLNPVCRSGSEVVYWRQRSGWRLRKYVRRPSDRWRR